METLSLFHAALLGVVEGLTEFVPISSTGHLILVSHSLGLGGEKIETFEIFIQLGAVLAVLALYWQRYLGLLRFTSIEVKAALDAKSFQGLAGCLKLALGAAPVFLIGGIAGSKIKAALFSPLTVASALVMGGLIMIVVERWPRRVQVEEVESISGGQAFFVGLFQCLALWPGMSRSGSTIVGGMLLGISRRAAAEFSFLLAVPVMAAATLVDLLKSLHALDPSDFITFATGFLVAFVVAFFSVRWFMALVGRVSLIPFACYRIAIGVLVLMFVGR